MLQKIDSQEILVYAMCLFHESKMVRAVVGSVRAMPLNTDWSLGKLHVYASVGTCLQRLQFMSDILRVVMY